MHLTKYIFQNTSTKKAGRRTRFVRVPCGRLWGKARLLHHHSGLSRSHDSNLCAHKASVCSWRQCNQPLPLYSAHFNTSTTWAAFHVSRERHLVTWGIMVISEKSSYLDPLVMNSSTTTGGRWCTPASNAESFMSSSPSYCVAASPGGGWGAQGELAIRTLPQRPLINCKCFELSCYWP